ncbi:phage head closure protein [Neorhizobium sp. LjRoot104]|uniref:phage head closure protein n=1 Tax=Neorhizobium sp. LjRoot104 TaxID=3342254 RepID=UPI003ED12D6B
MRAGKLDKTITIQRSGLTVDDYGTETEGWNDVATVRAQLVQQSTEEFMRSFGSSSEMAVIFRVRYRDDLTPSDRITYQGQAYDVKEIKELGRREGLDLRCVAVGA